MNVVTRSLATALVAGVAAACAPAALAQTPPPDDADAWRVEVDRLLDRWADDVGSSRLTRARDLVKRRLEVAPNDGPVLVELARLELALGRADRALGLVEDALGLYSDVEKTERTRLAETNAARERNKLPPIEPGAELVDRRGQALALAYLAATDNALSRARPLEGDAAQSALRERQAELSRRRQALFNVVGEEQGAQLARQENARRLYLRTLDRLGQEPRPIGHTDAAEQPIDMKAYRGKILLVVFWSHALGGGEEVLLEVDQVQKEHAERGVEVLGVCLDPPGGPASQWLAEKKITWRQVFTGEGLLSRDARAWEVASVPSGVLIDPAGKVRWIDPWEGDLRMALAELLRRKDEKAATDKRRGW